MERKPIDANMLTMGLDGADSEPAYEVDSYMVIAVAFLAGVLTFVMAAALVELPPVLLQWWQLVAGALVWGFICYMGGVVTMACMAMAHSDMDGAE